MTNETSVPQQYITAAIRRQHILDYLNAHQGSKLADTRRYVEQVSGVDTSIDNSIRVMLGIGEVRATGQAGNWSYFAIATQTMSPEAMAAKRRAALRENAVAQHNPTAAKRKSKPGHYIHTPGHYDSIPGHEQGGPLRHQGGQGGLRGRVYAGIVGTLI